MATSFQAPLSTFWYWSLCCSLANSGEWSASVYRKGTNIRARWEVLVISRVKVTACPSAVIFAGMFLIESVGWTPVLSTAGATVTAPTAGVARAAGAVATTDAEARAATGRISRDRDGAS
ncbi:hypothetical protein ACWDRR_20430 [Kitasatospora sp. NPDC003701]